MDKFQNPPHIPMDLSTVVPTPVLGQTSMTVSLDTDALIAAHQGAAWKISGWPENITIHHAKGCACCHEYINHLLGAQSLRQINLQCLNIENAVQSGPHSSTALKSMLINVYKGKSVIFMCRSMNLRTLFATRRSHIAMLRLHSQKSTAR